MPQETIRCEISGKEYPLSEMIRGKSINSSLFKLVKENHPDLKESSLVHPENLEKYRKEYLERLLDDDGEGLSNIESEVVNSITSDELLSKNLEEDHEKLGDRVADKIAEFGGSWTFIISFFTFIVLWMGINVYFLAKDAFDVYPFILLNLILSCLAAIQAPIIMMSQNRQEEKDRRRAIQDYKVNLKAELEIRSLQEKIDHLIVHQNHKLLEIQQIQIEMIEEISKKLDAPKNNS